MTPGPLMRPPGPGNQIGYQWSPPTRSHRDRNGSSSNTRLMESLPVCELRANNHLAPSRENVATILGLPLSLGQCFGARHPREKHLVYVVRAAGQRIAKNEAANGLPLAEKTAKSHSKCEIILFFYNIFPRSVNCSVSSANRAD